MKTLLTTLLAAALALPALAANETQVRVKVNGLVCDFCVRNIQKVFAREPSVENVKVDLDGKIVSLGLRPGAAIDDARIDKLVRDAGYNVVSIERGGRE